MPNMVDRLATTSSTLMPQDKRSNAEWLACAAPEIREAFLDGLSPNALAALPYQFEFWALPHQLPPEGDWRSWLVLGGRGAGKTRAGAEWVRAQVEGATPLAEGRARRVALVGETFEQIRDVMVFGESGIIACSPPDRVPKWHAGHRELQWANGAVAKAYSAHDPEGLRGPQFDAAWADELGKWKKADEAWDMLQFALRLGEHPQVVVTTTPRNVPALKDLLLQPTTVKTHATTQANRANLADSFLQEVQRRYYGTRRGREELDGEFLEEAEGALWSLQGLEKTRLGLMPEFSRIVVAVDPPVTGKSTSDSCGIIVVGARTEGPPQDWSAVVLEDASVQGASPTEWATRAVETYRRYEADCLVAEVNQGGDLVETVVRQIDPTVSYRAVRASRGKSARAEPVAALYDQGRVKHAHAFNALEDQMMLMTAQGYAGRGSPDRVDALVWGIHEALIKPAANWVAPRLRVL